MISSLLIEAALRSVFLALAVWIGLRILSVCNVLAQKVAWGLVLVSALTMPLMLPMTEHWSVLPANVRVTIPADPENLLEELQARIKAKTSPEGKPSGAVPPPGADTSSVESSEDNDRSAMEDKQIVSPPAIVEANSNADFAMGGGASHRNSEQITSQTRRSTVERTRSAMTPMLRGFSLLQLAALVYLTVAGVLCSRLLYGILVAWKVRRSARPEVLDLSPLTDGLRLRVSESIASPVTIGSTVVLPKDYREWDSEKLRIVLAHERSHIRQGDFYLQLLAGLYAAMVWFSPLGWWLKRKLSDLAEAISDRAGLEEAADRASYAQILLEFAAAPRTTLIGVAMARHGSISRRIERLLNDVSFRQAFADTRRALVAVIVVPVALFAATTLVHVQAAGQQAPAAPNLPAVPTAPIAAPARPAAPAEGVSIPEQITDETDQTSAPASSPQAPEKSVTPKAGESCPPNGLIAPAHAPAAPAHAPASPVVAPVAPAHLPGLVFLSDRPMGEKVVLSSGLQVKAPLIVFPRVAALPSHATLALIAPVHAGFGEGHVYGIGQSTTTESGTVIASNNGKRSGYRYSYSTNGNSYAVVRGSDKQNLTFSGNWAEGRQEEIAKARKQAGGKDFLWFTHDGRAYFDDDPATLAQIEAMYKPMEEIGRQQEELGKKQEALGKQQEELGKQQEAASVPTPDMSREIAKIDEAMAKLKASQGKNMTQDQFADLQEKLAELQSRIGEIQGQIGEKQGQFGERMGQLGERMGELGAQMGELGERQGKIAQDADQKIRAIIDQSLKNGKAKPVQ